MYYVIEQYCDTRFRSYILNKYLYVNIENIQNIIFHNTKSILWF